MHSPSSVLSPMAMHHDEMQGGKAAIMMLTKPIDG
jgi:hypothetical protein